MPRRSCCGTSRSRRASLRDSVARSLAARAKAKALDVDIDIAKRLPGRVSGDEVRLRSALENLVDNAVKFTERGGIGFAVSSAAARRAGACGSTFTVTDSGMGITAADLKRLFRPFAQASEEVARRYGGAGLGLVFVKRIAKAMGGDLVVTSKPGRGSTFRLTVVMKSAASAARRRASAASRSRACACSASRTIPTAASCTARCCASSATA